MPIIECPDCKKQVSDRSKQCIHCGCPIESNSINEAVQSQKSSLVESHPAASTADASGMPGKSFTTTGKVTANREILDLSCPECGHQDTKKLSLVVEDGTSSVRATAIGSSIGSVFTLLKGGGTGPMMTAVSVQSTSGKYVSALASRFAVPTRPEKSSARGFLFYFGMAASGFLAITSFVLFSEAAGRSGARATDDRTLSLIALLASISLFAIVYRIAIWKQREVYDRINNAASLLYDCIKNRHDSSLLCNRCGHVFPFPGSNIDKMAYTVKINNPPLLPGAKNAAIMHGGEFLSRVMGPGFDARFVLDAIKHPPVSIIASVSVTVAKAFHEALHTYGLNVSIVNGKGDPVSVAIAPSPVATASEDAQTDSAIDSGDDISAAGKRTDDESAAVKALKNKYNMS